jgi:hypothetical protein
VSAHQRPMPGADLPLLSGVWQGCALDLPASKGRAANIVRGPTSSRRFTAQSGPVVLSYGLTVMTSSWK